MRAGIPSWLRALPSALFAAILVFAPEAGRPAPLGEILADLNVEGYSLGSRPTYLGTVGGRAVFQILWGESTALTWITDGTAEGTHTLAIGQRDDNPPQLTYLGTAGSHLFLYLRDQGSDSNDAVLAVDVQGTVTRVLQEADGWELTYLGDPDRHRVAGGSLAIVAWNLSSQNDVLLFIDGETLTPSTAHASTTGRTQLLGAMGSRLVFSVSNATGSEETLWRSAGSAATTEPYATLSGQIIGSRAAAGNAVVYFTLTEPGDVGNELWATDGEGGGSVRLTSLADPAARIGTFHFDGDRAFFSVNDASFGLELFVSDATRGGTRAVTTFGNHQPFDYEPLVAIAGGRAYFIATDGLASNRLWIAGDRPEDLRALVEDVVLDSSSAWIATAGGSVFVATRDDQGRTQVFVSNGSAAGTHEVPTGCVDPCYLAPAALAATSTTFYFTGSHPSSPSPTAYSTRPPFDSAQPLYDALKEGPQFDTSVSRSVAVAGEVVYFAASQGQGHGEPWLTAGTPATTSMIRRLAIRESSSDPKRFRASAEGALAFTTDFQHPDRVWLRPTAESALEPVAGDYDVCYYGSDVYPATGGFVFRDCNADFWFVASAGGSATRLTELYSQLSDLSLGNGQVVGFVRWTGTAHDVWRLGGSPPHAALAQTITADLGYWNLRVAGTNFIIERDLDSGHQLYSLGENLTAFEPLSPVFSDLSNYLGSAELGRGFFGATDLENRSGVWATDGTSAGTQHLFPSAGYSTPLDAVRLADGWAILAQVAEGESYEMQVWRTDGTAAGSVRLAAIPQAGDVNGSRLVAVGDRLLVTRRTDADVFELLSIPLGGGEPESLLPDGVSISRQGAQIVTAGARVFFTACDTPHGCELWLTSGTAESTRLAHDILPGAQSSSPHSFLALGDEVVFVADDGLHGIEPWHVPAAAGEECADRPGALCLEGDRYLVRAQFKAPGERVGDGREIPLTADTGAFWFFTPANVELVVKLIDGGGFNGHEWVFYGALSNIEYSIDVADAATGESRRYFNPAGRFASAGDIAAFPTRTAAGERGPQPPGRESEAGAGGCVSSPTRFCIFGGRFSVEAVWRDFAGNTGVARATGLTDDTGYFWFFNGENIEIVVKAIDGSAFNGHFWIYYGALSNVEYTFTVTDTVTGAVRPYHNPLGRFGSSGDITAFPAD